MGAPASWKPNPPMDLGGPAWVARELREVGELVVDVYAALDAEAVSGLPATLSRRGWRGVWSRKFRSEMLESHGQHSLRDGAEDAAVVASELHSTLARVGRWLLDGAAACERDIEAEA